MQKNNFLKVYKNKKILITGSTGFKGSWLSFWLYNLGAKIIGVGLKPENGAILYKTLKIDKLINQYYFDITNFRKLNNLIKKISQISYFISPPNQLFQKVITIHLK